MGRTRQRAPTPVDRDPCRERAGLRCSCWQIRSRRVCPPSGSVGGMRRLTRWPPSPDGGGGRVSWRSTGSPEAAGSPSCPEHGREAAREWPSGSDAIGRRASHRRALNTAVRRTARSVGRASPPLRRVGVGPQGSALHGSRAEHVAVRELGCGGPQALAVCLARCLRLHPGRPEAWAERVPAVFPDHRRGHQRLPGG